MSDNNQDNQDTRKPEEIESDIEENRERLDRTLHELEEKISPRRLIDTTMDYVRSGGANEFASNLSDTIKNNPVPFVLTGVGLGWLIMAQRNPDKYSRRNRYNDDVDTYGYEDSRHYPMTTRPAPTGASSGSTAGLPSDSTRVPPTTSVPSSTSVPPTSGTTAGGTTVGSTTTTSRVPPAAYTTGTLGDNDYDDRQGKGRMSGAKEKAQNMSSSVKDGARNMSNSVKGRAQSMSSSMRDGTSRMKSGSRSAMRGASQSAQNAGQQTTQFIQEHPLVTAALGVAIGAAIGSLLPSTRFEDEQFGDTRDKLVDRAAEEGQKQADNVQSKVEEKAQKAKQDAPNAPDSGGTTAGSSSSSGSHGASSASGSSSTTSTGTAGTSSRTSSTSGAPGTSGTSGTPSTSSGRPTEQDISKTDIDSGNPPNRGV
nr:DUF3618 domain-containing protein [uncultured Halomonas sp.]